VESQGKGDEDGDGKNRGDDTRNQAKSTDLFFQYLGGVSILLFDIENFFGEGVNWENDRTSRRSMSILRSIHVFNLER
jgi:hypothetical protein